MAQRKEAKFLRQEEEEEIVIDTPTSFLDLRIKQEPDW